MSLDLWMESPLCEKCGHHDSGESFNCTYNLGDMWREVYPGEGLVEIEGMSGRVAELKVKVALDALKSDPERFEKLNPANGWGSYEGFVRFLENILGYCKEKPDWIWVAGR
jgi:hypothetical protein